MGFVAYGPAALIHAQSKRGTALVNGRRLTAFPDVHETAAHLDQRPFSLETELRNLGAHFCASDSEREYVVHDKRLVTGQNIASSAGAAREGADDPSRRQRDRCASCAGSGHGRGAPFTLAPIAARRRRPDRRWCGSRPWDRRPRFRAGYCLARTAGHGWRLPDRR
jgi:hypothetical protein